MSDSSSGGLPEVCLSSSDDSKDSSPPLNKAEGKNASLKNNIKDAPLPASETLARTEDKDASTKL